MTWAAKHGRSRRSRPASRLAAAKPSTDGRGARSSVPSTDSCFGLRYAVVGDDRRAASCPAPAPPAADATTCGSTPASRLSCGRADGRLSRIQLRRPRANGRPIAFDGYRERHERRCAICRALRDRYAADRRADRSASCRGRPGIEPAASGAGCASALSAVIEETDGAQILLGARPSAGDARFPPSRLLCARTAASKRRMKFGIDRLLADPALRTPLEGKRVALLAHPASVTADLTHSLDALAALRASTSPPPSGRSTACAATSRTIWWNRRLHRSGPRHPGVQPLRRGAPADRPVDGHVRRDAGRPAGPRLPHLHLHHDPALRARGGGASTARRCGCSTGPTRPAGRSRG